jgi:hypothetical protein
VLGHGWKRAVELQVGDQVTSHTGQWLPIEANDSTGRFETVYNLRVAQDHTYFVGHDDWGFSVWVHCANYRSYRDMLNAGISTRDAQNAIQKAYKYFDSLGAF